MLSLTHSFRRRTTSLLHSEHYSVENTNVIASSSASADTLLWRYYAVNSKLRSQNAKLIIKHLRVQRTPEPFSKIHYGLRYALISACHLKDVLAVGNERFLEQDEKNSWFMFQS